MRRLGLLRLLGVVFVTACSSDATHDPDGSVNDSGLPADTGSGDSSTADGSIDAGASEASDGGTATSPLLLSEIVLAPDSAELIEIVNTTNQAVDLSTYYLSDSGSYFKLPTGGVTLDANDFIARFPKGAMIPGHGVIIVAVNTVANFTTQYGIAPSFSIVDLAIMANAAPALTNAGEIVVLFQWDGASDLVRDADIMLAGSPAVSNTLVDKSGVMQDGPDGDTQTSTYRPDLNTIPKQSSTPGAGMSTKRVAVEGTHETHAGTGNGIAGDDETSEDITTTWDSSFTAATPGQVPQALLQ
jgi:hypothetical protein